MTEELAVLIPEEKHALVSFRQDELPGVAVINSALVDFQPRVVFRWHLSIWITLEDLIENGMPSQAERDIVDHFGDELETQIKGSIEKPNALFLARIT